MKHILNFCFAAFLATGLSTVCFSQDSKPAVPEEVKNAGQWIGKWSGTLTMTMEGKTYKPTATWSFRQVAGGYGILLEEEMSDPVLGKISSADLMGFDPYDQKIHVFTVDNMGNCHDHLCEWKSPDRFYLEHNSVRNGKKYTEKIEMVMKGADAFETTYNGYLDGKVTETGTGSFKRVK